MQDFLFAKTNGGFTRVDHADIIYIESLKNYVRIVTIDVSFIVLATMGHVEDVLPQDQFCRIHRSYIVALNRIKRFNGKCVMLGEKELPISEQHRDTLMKKLVILTSEPKSKTIFPKK